MSKNLEIPKINGDFTGKSIVSIDQFDIDDVDRLVVEAVDMEKMVRSERRSDILSDRLVANLFYEPSTRTFLSFEAAAKRLSAETIATQGVEYSSISKGETLEDTIRTVERYADIITLRHGNVGAAAIAANVSNKPIINAGDGIGEHPSQALLDMLTIRKEAVNPPEDLTVTLLGDLKNGRTVHSLAKLLSLYGARLNYVSPEELRMPSELEKRLGRLGIEQYSTTDLDEVLDSTDVLYVTRIQKERFVSQEEYDKHKSAYIIDEDTMARAPEHMIVMHPLPRVGEISPSIDNDPRAVYFDQVENGMYLRMAMLALVAGRSINPSRRESSANISGQLSLV